MTSTEHRTRAGRNGILDFRAPTFPAGSDVLGRHGDGTCLITALLGVASHS